MTEKGATPQEPPTPPRWPRRLLIFALRADDAALVVPDLDELYAERVEQVGMSAARGWYVRQVASCAWRLGVRERFPGDPVNHDGKRERRSLRIGDLWRELRIVARSLWRTPAFATMVVVALAVGVSGVTVAWSLAHWVLLRPVPGVTKPAALKVVQLELGDGGAGPGGAGFPFSQPDAEVLGARIAHAGEATFVASQEIHFAADAARPAERVAAQFAWPNYFGVLGVKLQTGRSFESTDGNVVVVSDALARRFWRTPSAATGASVYVNGVSYRVGGVAPPDFHGAELPGTAELWISAASLPVAIHSPAILRNGSAQVWETMLLRARDGVSSAQVAKEMNDGVAVIRTLGRPHSFMMKASFRAYDGVGPSVYLRNELNRTMRLIAIAALALGLLACANASNLGLARAVTRTEDAAMRRALGAGAAEVIRERIMEWLLLGVCAAGVSTMLTAGVLGLLRRFSLMNGAVSLENLHLQTTALPVSALVALCAAAIAGLLPSLIATGHARRLSGRTGAHGDRTASRMRDLLVVAQMAMSIVLVAWAILLIRTTINLRHIDLGFDRRNVVQFALDPDMQGYDAQQARTLMRDLIAALEASPGVEAAALMDHGIFDRFTFPASLVDPNDTKGSIFARRIQMSPGMERVLGLRLLAGRPLDSEWLTYDSTRARTGMLNEAALHAVLPGVSPAGAIGRTIAMRAAGAPQQVTITGVVSNARLNSLDNRDSLAFFQPWAQGWETGQFSVLVRTRSDARRVEFAIRDVVRRLDRALPVYGMRTLEESVDDQISEQRFIALIAATLACTGIALALLGIYGSLSYAVHQRTPEIGVRAALGARPSSLLSDVVRNGLALALAGAGVGTVIAVNFSRMLASRLFGVTPFDASTYVFGAAAVLGISIAASAIPGWRAARIDPLRALRQE